MKDPHLRNEIKTGCFIYYYWVSSAFQKNQNLNFINHIYQEKTANELTHVIQRHGLKPHINKKTFKSKQETQ